jgi:type I restriction enzyme, S subunit
VNELPPNWLTAILSQIAFIEMGQSPDSRSYNDQGKGLPFFQGKADFGKLYPTVRKWCTEPTKVVEAGDILLSVRAPVGPTNLAQEKSCIGRGLAAIRAVDLIDQKYLLHFFKNIEPWLMQQGTGTTFKAISGDFIQNIEVVIAPLNEEKRIADKLDVLLSRVNSCRVHLERVPRVLKCFRQSVLAMAISGLLTEEWRKIRNQDKVWPVKKIKEITSKVGSGATPSGGEKSYKSSGIPLIRSMNVVFYSFKRDGLVFLDDDQAYNLRNVEVKTNDVLLNITGASIGRVTLAPSDLEGARVNQHVCIIRPTEIVLPEFLCAFLSAPAMQELIGAENYGVTRQALTKEQILGFDISVPSLAEQYEIIRRINRLFAFIDRLDSRYTTALTLVDSLTPALLSKAFRGELVQQDLNDESASILLERIKISKQNAPKEIKKTRRRIGMEILTQKAKNQRVGIVQALLEAKKELSTEQLFYFAGYPNDAEAELIEDFFVDIRDALKDRKIKKRRDNNVDWFSLVTQ